MTSIRRTGGVKTIFSWTILLWAIASTVDAYNPPSDTTGPLTATIEGPEQVTETDTPLPVRVVLENRGDRPLDGTVRLGVIDRWTAEPAGAVRFSVDAKSTTRVPFTVTAGSGTYGAHYPIHAHVEFESDGRARRAHPILILETKLPTPLRTSPAVEWQASPVPENGRLALWRVPRYRAVVMVSGQEPQIMPVAWQGSAEPSGGSLVIGTETLADEPRETVVMHPPWKQGMLGTMLVEFPLRLSDRVPLMLRFDNAVTPTGEGDGVTFRVRAVPFDAPDGTLERILFERHDDSRTWHAAEVDLSPIAGQTVRLQLESHPGPANNTGWDRSFWAEPTLVCGTPSEPPPFPPRDASGSRLLGTLAEISASRENRSPCEVRVWPGRRGLLDAVVGFRCGEQELHFRGFEVRVLGGRLDDDRSPVLLLKTSEEPCRDGYRVRHHFQSHLGTFDLVASLWVEGPALSAEFHLENVPEPQPWSVVFLEDVAAGPFGRELRQVYAGAGNVIRRPKTFRLNFDGHRLSTSFVGFDFDGGPSLLQAVDVPPSSLEVQPGRRHYSLHAPHASCWKFIPAENVWDAVRAWRDVNGLEAADGVPKAAGRFVFDLWGGRYGQSTEELRRAFRYGLTHSMVVWHNWQRWGYDYRLPDIYPANPTLGTHEELRRLIETCRQADVPIALHDNYIDLYPDAEGFSYEKNIAFSRNGMPVKAWLNEHRDARSYRYRADRVEPFLRRNLPLIRDGLNPDAYFIDVWSSIQPYDYWTANGRFFDRVYTRDSWREHFAWIRDFLGDHAPQISESGHDQLIGWLDAAQTNHLRVGNPRPDDRYGWAVWPIECEDAERTCWFDAAHHDRFVLHGAGYSSRYRAGLDPRMHGIQSDDYISTEVLTGHPAMVPGPFGRDVVRKYWLTGPLMQALALRTIERVDYVDGNLHRQHVRWSGDAEVWVNRGTSDWTVGGTTLPEFGFMAQVPTDAGSVEVALERHEGLIVETARSPGSLYINGRRPGELPLPVGLTVESIEYLGSRRLRLTLRWQVDVAIPPEFHPFFHFCDSSDQIAFQAVHASGKANRVRLGENTTTAVATVPEECVPGESYTFCFGFYRPGTGQRLDLVGPGMGDHRIRLGTVRLEGKGEVEESQRHGTELADIAWQPVESTSDPFLARQNLEAHPIDFGPVVTAGGCRLIPDGRALILTPLPNDKGPGFTVRIDWSELPWPLPEPSVVTAIAEDGRKLDRTPVSLQDGTVTLETRPGVFCYRLEPE